MKKIAPVFLLWLFFTPYLHGQKATKQETIDWLNSKFDKYLSPTFNRNNGPHGIDRYSEQKVHFGDDCTVTFSYVKEVYPNGEPDASPDSKSSKVIITKISHISKAMFNATEFAITAYGFREENQDVNNFDVSEDNITQRIPKAIYYLRDNFCAAKSDTGEKF